jgi:hypothetical protein
MARGLVFTLFAASPLAAQPVIVHDEVGCLPRGEFTRFLATIEPASTIRAAKLYFRSELYRDFYFVAMAQDPSGSFSAALPLPSAETTTVVYYIEAVDLSFQTSRSDELEADVSDESGCRRGPGAALLPGGSPGIVVGATQMGAPAIPAGFEATGITGFLTATGSLAGAGGGGIGVGVAVGAAAGAAAGVGVLVAGGGEDGTATTTAPSVGGGSPTSAPSTSSTTTTTTGTGGGSTTTIGPTTAPPTTIPSTTTALPTLTACFEWQARGKCKVYFDSCSTPAGSIVRYEWRMLGPPVPEPPPLDRFEFSFASDPRCRGTKSFNYPVRHTVYDRSGRSARIQQNVTVQSGLLYGTDDGESATVSFESRLAALPADGRARGQIAVNGVGLSPSHSASPSRHDVAVGAGTVRIELTVLTPVAPGSLWELDFSSSASLVPGSLKPEAGGVAAADDRRVVFRLNGDRGETLRLRLSVR